MALKIFDKFAPRANPADSNHPYGSIKNESVPGAKDGTPLDAAWGNDMGGFTDALLAEAGIVPSGAADTALVSQRLEALKGVVAKYNTLTVTQLLALNLPVGSTVALSDRDFASFEITTGLSANGFDIIDIGMGKQAKLSIEKGEFNVCAFGAIGNGVADDYLPIQRANVAAVEYANNVGNGAIILYPPKDFYITSTVCPLPEGENTLDRYNTGQAGTLTTKVENITIRGYGARLICDTATFSPLFPFCMMTSIEADNVKVYGLKLESDLNNKVPNWIDPSNYFNRTVPTVTGEIGFIALRTTGFKFIDCPVYHCEAGLVITDDRTFNIPTPDPMNTYRSEVRGCDFFNCWQLMSMTYGATEELIIHSNHFRYGFIKFVQESDQGRAMMITTNTFRDISGILTNTNDTQIVNNTFNNLLGGISLQPQGGSNPSTDYNYDLTNILIKDNTCYSDHGTEVDGEAIGSGTDLPSTFLRISATVAATAGQTVNIDNLRVEGNSGVLWGVGGSSTGAFINRDGNASINIKSMSVTGKNKFTLKSGVTATVCLSNIVSYESTSISGTLDISNNEITREGDSGVVEFQFHFGSSQNESLLIFKDNIIRMPGSRYIVGSVRNVQRVECEDNNIVVSPTTIAITRIFDMNGIREYSVKDNEVKRGGGGNIGYLVYHDGFDGGTYSTMMDEGKYIVTGNTIDYAQFVFQSPLTFPESSLSFFNLENNTIQENAIKTFQTYPSISGFNAFNAVNPHNSSDSPRGDVKAAPPYFIIQNARFVTGEPSAWKYDGTWRPMFINP